MLMRPPAASILPPARLRNFSSRAKRSSRSVRGVTVSSRLIVSTWSGAVISGVRLVNSIRPFRPCTLPAGLVKSSSGMVTTPELVEVVGDQSMRPSNPAEPSTGDFR
ncbi:hypothetical protein D3C87_1341750 [compost metagenome]